MYVVKEIFYTLQGEGINSGRAAVFCRFAGCNLWNGRPENRSTATCKFCDTDFVGVGPDGGNFRTASALGDAIAAHWPTPISRAAQATQRRLVVFTGGEPLLQLDQEIVSAMHAHGFEVAVETNGTQVPPKGIDHLCVSPKAGAPLQALRGQELKLVYPQAEASAHPEIFEGLAFDHFFLQPMDGPNVSENTRRAVEYCLAHPRWRLSLQTHKLAGVR